MAKQSAGSILASLRWRKTSKAKRKAISKAMHRAKALKRLAVPGLAEEMLDGPILVKAGVRRSDGQDGG